MNINLGIINYLYEVSLHSDENYIDLWATSVRSTGWYRASIGWDGTINKETVMLANGNYSHAPSASYNAEIAPHMRAILAAIPVEQSNVADAVRLAYGFQGE